MRTRQSVRCALAAAGLCLLLAGCGEPTPLQGVVVIPKETDRTTETTFSPVADETETTAATTGDTTETTAGATETPTVIVINTGSKRFHIDPQCSAVKQMKSENYAERPWDQLEILYQQGYTACGICAKEYKK